MQFFFLLFLLLLECHLIFCLNSFFLSYLSVRFSTLKVATIIKWHIKMTITIACLFLCPLWTFFNTFLFQFHSHRPSVNERMNRKTLLLCLFYENEKYFFFFPFSLVLFLIRGFYALSRFKMRSETLMTIGLTVGCRPKTPAVML